MLYRLDRIVPVELTLPEGFTMTPLEEGWEEWIPCAAEEVLALRNADGDVLGVAAIGHAEGRAAVLWLQVREDCRRQGYGLMLCRYALKLIRRWNELPVLAPVPEESLAAQGLLAKLGFTAPQAVAFDLSCIQFDDKGLVPAIAQDARTGAVLMLAYMNAESLRATLDSGYATYFSRSQQKLWRKGETSGHWQKILGIRYDCDGDTLLLTVEQTGPACHTGAYSCFHNDIVTPEAGALPATAQVMEDVYRVIADRAANPKPGSYTNYLLDKGKEKICKKVGEEASEAIIAAMKNNPTELCAEAGDLIYHLLVLLYAQGVTPQNLWGELAHRR